MAATLAISAGGQPSGFGVTVAPMADIEIHGPPVDRSDEILTPEALEFVADLHRRYGKRRDELLAARVERRTAIAEAGTLDFLPETADVRAGDWTVAEVPADLQDRRVEITGPTTRKMSINALNSGAKVWLADLEDANTPHWENVVGGQVNLRDAVRRDLAFTSPEGKDYAIADPDRIPVIVPRPRGWHLDEAHLTVDGTPVPGGLVDFGLYFFHNATELLARGSGPYFYLPKMESHLEARLWNDVFTHAQTSLGVPHGTIRATVLIETITAAFEMDEILFELRDHMAGLNAGRWDYLFSIIKNFRDAGPAFTLPDRNAVTMNAPMMKAYSDLLVRSCHRRGAFAIGGMAAFIPSRRDAEVNERAFAKVREDKNREAEAGFDGSWVAHPDLVPVCEEIFDRVLGDRPNQVDVLREDVDVSAADLLAVDRTPGERTEQGLRGNVRIGIQYLQAWLSGNGAAAINNLMEDAATAEISRSQVWQWIYNDATLDTGETVTRELVQRIVEEEYDALRTEVGDSFAAGHWDVARDLFVDSALAEDYPDFLTIPAYAALLAAEQR
jgi:malate synthase